MDYSSFLQPTFRATRLLCSHCAVIFTLGMGGGGGADELTFGNETESLKSSITIWATLTILFLIALFPVAVKAQYLGPRCKRLPPELYRWANNATREQIDAFKQAQLDRCYAVGGRCVEIAMLRNLGLDPTQGDLRLGIYTMSKETRRQIFSHKNGASEFAHWMGELRRAGAVVRPVVSDEKVSLINLAGRVQALRPRAGQSLMVAGRIFNKEGFGPGHAWSGKVQEDGVVAWSEAYGNETYESHVWASFVDPGPHDIYGTQCREIDRFLATLPDKSLLYGRAEDVVAILEEHVGSKAARGVPVPFVAYASVSVGVQRRAPAHLIARRAVGGLALEGALTTAKAGLEIGDLVGLDGKMGFTETQQSWENRTTPNEKQGYFGAAWNAYGHPLRSVVTIGAFLTPPLWNSGNIIIEREIEKEKLRLRYGPSTMFRGPKF